MFVLNLKHLDCFRFESHIRGIATADLFDLVLFGVHVHARGHVKDDLLGAVGVVGC